MHRVITPFVSARRYDPTQAPKHLQWTLEAIQKIFAAAHSSSTALMWAYFWSNMGLKWVSNAKKG